MVWYRLECSAPAELSAKTQEVLRWNETNDYFHLSLSIPSSSQPYLKQKQPSHSPPIAFSLLCNAAIYVSLIFFLKS